MTQSLGEQFQPLPDCTRSRVIRRTGSRRRPLPGRHRRVVFGGQGLQQFSGFLGQRHFRHKTTKASYQFVFRATVFFYQVVPFDYLLGWPGLRWTLAMMAELVAKIPT